MEHSKIDIENDDDDYQFADINLFGSTSEDLGSDQEHSNEDMAIEHGLPGEITGEKEIRQYFVDYDSNKDTQYFRFTGVYTQTVGKERKL